MKGTAFPKTLLQRLKRGKHIWEVDFQRIPVPEGDRVTAFLGLAVRPDHHLVAVTLLDHAPAADDLAGLLAYAMQEPRGSRPQRPLGVRLRNRREWAELLPHLLDLDLELHLTNTLRTFDAAAHDLISKLKFPPIPEPVQMDHVKQRTRK